MRLTRDLPSGPDIPVLEPLNTMTELAQNDRLSLAIQVEDVAQTTAFRDLYLEAVSQDEANSEGRKLEDIIAHYAVHLPHLSRDAKSLALVLLESAIAAYGHPVVQADSNLIYSNINELLANSGDSDKGG